MAKNPDVMPENSIKVVKAGDLSPDRVLRGRCLVCGCEIEARRKDCDTIRGPMRDPVLHLGLLCPTPGCSNWIIMGAYDG